LFTVSVVVGVDAELDESLVVDMNETEDRIVSQWTDREVSAEERHEILRPLGLQTRLVVVERANSLALYFICMTLAALLSLRDQWRSHQLRETVRKLFNVISHRTLLVKRLTWPLADYHRCLNFFKSVEGKLTVQW